MEIVIKIPDKLYNNIIDIPESSMFSIDCDSRIRKAIQNGTPLPKGHGNLIDVNNVDKIVRPIEEQDNQWAVTGATAIQLIYDAFHRAKPIIEADKEV